MGKRIDQTLVEMLEQRAEEILAPSAGQGRPDDMAWAAIGLVVQDAAPELSIRLKRALADRQRPDGAVPLESQVPNAYWPTFMALLAWRSDPLFAVERELAVEFLLTHRGNVHEKVTDIVAHDPTIHGWPWIENTHSWVEPTSLVILAMNNEGLTKHPAVREAVTVLRDRMLPDGGWNYGNTFVYGAQLRPMPDSTGVALCAMRHELSETDAEMSLAYLEKEYTHLRTPLSLSWGIMGLSAWGRRPVDVEEKVAQSLALQERYGPYETALLGLLAACLTDFPFERAGGAV